MSILIAVGESLQEAYPNRAHKNPGQRIRAGRVGPHGDCGLRDSVNRRLIASVRVQLFYVGALDFTWRRRAFDFRLFDAELDQQAFLFLGRQFADHGDANSAEPDVVVENHFTEAVADSTAWRVEGDCPAAAQPIGPSLQRDVIIPASRCTDDKILLIQNPVSSDT